MTCSLAEWLSSDLLKKGILRDEAWVPDSAGRADKLYFDPSLSITGTAIALSCPQAIDYLEQAPILALAALEAGTPELVSVRERVILNFRSLLLGGPKLRLVLDACGVARPLRVIFGLGLQPWHGVLLGALQSCNPSTLAQSIPPDGRQILWLRILSIYFGQFVRRLGYVPDDARAWALREFKHLNYDADPDAHFDALADYHLANGIRMADTFAQAEQSSLDWHQQVPVASYSAAEIMASYGLRMNDLIDYGKLPNGITINGYLFRALRTAHELKEEGEVMEHCVFSYLPTVASGTSRVYSVRNPATDERVATLELSTVQSFAIFSQSRSNVWAIVQLRGRSNRPPVTEVCLAAALFERHINSVSLGPKPGTAPRAPPRQYLRLELLRPDRSRS